MNSILFASFDNVFVSLCCKLKFVSDSNYRKMYGQFTRKIVFHESRRVWEFMFINFGPNDGSKVEHHYSTTSSATTRGADGIHKFLLFRFGSDCGGKWTNVIYRITIATYSLIENENEKNKQHLVAGRRSLIEKSFQNRLLIANCSGICLKIN